MMVESCTQALCDLALRFGEDRSGKKKEDIMSRPFGVALLVAGIDEKGPSLYHCDPSGTFVQYKAKAIGAASEGAQNALQEQYNNSLTLAEAQIMALSILKQVMEEEIKPTNVELAAIPMATKKFEVATDEQIGELIEVVNKKHEEEEAAALAQRV